MAEEAKIVQYMEDMVITSCPLNTTQLRLEVAKITQATMIPFTNGDLGSSSLDKDIHS